MVTNARPHGGAIRELKLDCADVSAAARFLWEEMNQIYQLSDVIRARERLLRISGEEVVFERDGTHSLAVVTRVELAK